MPAIPNLSWQNVSYIFKKKYKCGIPKQIFWQTNSLKNFALAPFCWSTKLWSLSATWRKGWSQQSWNPKHMIFVQNAKQIIRLCCKKYETPTNDKIMMKNMQNTQVLWIWLQKLKNEICWRNGSSENCICRNLIWSRAIEAKTENPGAEAELQLPPLPPSPPCPFPLHFSPSALLRS